LKGEWINSILNSAIKEAELKRDVSIVYCNLQFMLQKKELLLKNDSLFDDFLKKAELRFEKGESNVTEKASAQLQQSQIHLQLLQLLQDIDMLQLQFQLLLNSETRFIPETKVSKEEIVVVLDTNSFIDHPQIKLLEQQKYLALLNTKLEKAKLLPEMYMSYSNMSMRGMGADNVLYSTSLRFKSAQVGIGIPLFFGSHTARIKAARTNQLISDNNYNYGLKEIRTTYNSLLIQYKTQLQTYNYLESKVISALPIISETATKQFKSGAINYMEWVMFINQAITIQNDYIETTRNLRETTILLNYLQTK
ncbi:MAG: TolC family protein, partial [Rhodospirillales bacterium]|nr:TolC family protein [Rhodospirillales bacterium]